LPNGRGLFSLLKKQLGFLQKYKKQSIRYKKIGHIAIFKNRKAKILTKKKWEVCSENVTIDRETDQQKQIF